MSPWASTPNSGGHDSGLVGCRVRYGVPPASWSWTWPVAGSMVGAAGKAVGGVAGGV